LDKLGKKLQEKRIEKYDYICSHNVMSNVNQQFIKMQTKYLIYKGTEYFVLIIEKWKYVIFFEEGNDKNRK